MSPSRRTRRLLSASSPMRSATSNPSATISTRASEQCRSISTPGCSFRNVASSGATLLMPKLIGAASRTRPVGTLAASRAASSAARASPRMRVAWSASGRPASVSASRRDVRWNSDWPICASSRLIALDTVALLSPIASAAPLNERCSTTAAKIAQASRSGSRIDPPTGCNRQPYPKEPLEETIGFQRFRLRADGPTPSWRPRQMETSR